MTIVVFLLMLNWSHCERCVLTMLEICHTVKEVFSLGCEFVKLHVNTSLLVCFCLQFNVIQNIYSYNRKRVKQEKTVANELHL
jgi:hypothetical protein